MGKKKASVSVHRGARVFVTEAGAGHLQESPRPPWWCPRVQDQNKGSQPSEREGLPRL